MPKPNGYWRAYGRAFQAPAVDDPVLDHLLRRVHGSVQRGRCFAAAQVGFGGSQVTGIAFSKPGNISGFICMVACALSFRQLLSHSLRNGNPLRDPECSRISFSSCSAMKGSDSGNTGPCARYPQLK